MDPANPEPQTPPENPEPAAPSAPSPTPEPPQPSPIAQQFSDGSKTSPDSQATGNGQLPSAFTLFKPSWEALKVNLTTFILLGLVPYVVIMAAALVLGVGSSLLHEKSSSMAPEIGIWAFVFALVVLAFSIVLAPALIHTQLQSVRGIKVAPATALKTGLHLCWRFLGVTFLSGLVIVLGFIALIVPGIIFLRRYFLASYFLVDRDLGVMEAMKQSAAATKGRAMAVWGLLGVTFLIGLLGIIPVLGSIASAVLSVIYYCAPGVRYAQLTGQPTATPSNATSVSNE